MTSKELREIQSTLFLTETIVSELCFVVENEEIFEDEEDIRAIAFASNMFFNKADKFGVSFVDLVKTTLNHFGISAKEEIDEKGRCVSLLVDEKMLLNRLYLGC